jgi:4-hydroxy-3-polyprenylbenzoate decarboxylase
MQVTGRDTTLMRWLRHRGGAQHHRRWGAAKREPLPAAVVIGADPGTIIAAVTPVPDTLSEYQFAGLLRGKRVDLVDCKTVPLKVPAEAESCSRHVARQYGDEGPTATTPAATTRSSSSGVRVGDHDAARRSICRLSPAGRPMTVGARRALNEVFIPLLQQQFPKSSISGCRQAAPIALRSCRSTRVSRPCQQ